MKHSFPGLVRTRGEVAALLDSILPKPGDQAWQFRGPPLEAIQARMRDEDALRGLLEWLLQQPKIYKRARTDLSLGVVNRFARNRDHWKDCWDYAYQRENKTESVLPHPPINMPKPTSKTAKKRLANEALDTRLKYFIGPRQIAVVRTCLRGEEGEYFADKMLELDALIAAMPKTYEQDGKGDDSIITLHYFAGGSANWWIKEKDMGCDPEPGETRDERQHQAFGLANLFGGPDDQDAELGYISIEEIIEAGGELDFHFAPRTLGELKTGKKPSAAPEPVAVTETDATPEPAVPASTSARDRLAAL